MGKTDLRKQWKMRKVREDGFEKCFLREKKKPGHAQHITNTH